jgi:CDP-diacylglycerol---serine O-phosphatidyltransferase
MKAWQRPLWNWRQVIPSLVTLAAMLAGFLSILVTTHGMSMAVNQPLAKEMYRWSALLIMLAMILDGLDGNLARWLKGQSEFGAELDTYVDLTAFGIAPAILVFAVTLQTRDPFWRVLLPSAVALSGVVRLAKFKVKDPLRGQGGYAGLPITANAAWVALFIYVTLAPPHDRLEGWLAILFLFGIVVFIVLQLTNLRYPKPTKKAALFVPCIVFVLALWALSLHKPLYAARLAVLMMGLGLLYVMVGPMFVKGVEAHRARKMIRENHSKEE